MDHIPYPLTSDLPGLEIPLLCGSKLFNAYHKYEPLFSAPGDHGNQGLRVNSCYVSRNTTWGVPVAERPQTSTAPKAGADARESIEALEVAHWTSTFWKYPKEQGWITEERSQRHWHTCSDEEAAIRAQEWLYFRLLENFLGAHVSVHTFTRPSASSGKVVIDSSMLPQLLQEWESRIQQRSSCGKLNANHEQSSHKESGKVLILLTEVLQESYYLDEKTEPSRSIAFSIKVLVETLAKAIWHISEDRTPEQWRIWRLDPTPLLADRMATAGWCSFQVAKIWYQYLPSTVYYLSSLPHRNTFGGVTHHTCTTDHCTSTSVDPRTYEPQHRKSCASGAANHNSCAMVSVDTASIADVILQGSFPLIEIQAKPSGGIELKVHKYTIGRHYIAISHVWSGGLGNVKSNSMLLCQLKYLHSLLHRLRDNGDDNLDRWHGSRKIDDGIDDLRAHLGFARKEMPLLLWIDTLCVPVGSEHKAAYTMTLRRMAQIYVTAQCVLVLDPELQNINHRTIYTEQTYAHILSSSWMSRSWTFQEACMARIWFVQFADGYFAVDEQYFEFQRVFSTVMSLSGSHTLWLKHDLTRWFREIPVLAKIRYRDPRELMSKMDDWQNFALAWNGLRDRSTTKVEDLYGIIAAVVDLSAGDILKLQQDERVKAIYRSQMTLPLSLLYQTSPKILDKTGYDTWAPSGIEGDRLDFHSGYLTVGPEGLFIDPSYWINISPPEAIVLTYDPSLSRYLEIETHEPQARRIVELVIGPTCPTLQKSGDTVCCIFDDTLLHHVPGLGFAHWPPPLQHVSKRAVSKRVIIRNTSNWIELSSVGLVSGPYIVGIIVCAIHRRSQLAGKLFWLCLSRWLSLLVEAVWALASLAQWDRHRTLDWTDRLYGTTTKPRVQHIKHMSQYPAFIARLPPLAVASTFLALYLHRRQPWMKVFAIILFAEVGLSLIFNLVVIYIMFLYVAHGWYEPVTRTFFSDLPEDPVEITDAQLRILEAKWQPGVDHRYRVAILVWRILDWLKSKERSVDNTDGIEWHA
ncbi:MAG: hypothetical protein Q9225_006768 [Loekoesia sp. 1 TL-2023]